MAEASDEELLGSVHLKRHDSHPLPKVCSPCERKVLWVTTISLKIICYIKNIERRVFNITNVHLLNVINSVLITEST